MYVCNINIYIYTYVYIYIIKHNAYKQRILAK